MNQFDLKTYKIIQKVASGCQKDNSSMISLPKIGSNIVHKQESVILEKSFLYFGIIVSEKAL